MRRVGIFGGSFDPLHNGHLILAGYAKQELALDYLMFVPCYESAYKDKVIQASTTDRERMLFESNRDLVANYRMTYCNKDLNYTIDMIKYYINYFKNDKVILLAGADTINNFDSWKDSKEIKKLADVKFAGKDFYVPQVGITSSLIRKLVSEGKSIKYLVPEVVEDYIIKHKLYKN